MNKTSVSKKLATALAAVVAIAFAATPSQASFSSSVSKSTFTATATVGGGTVVMGTPVILTVAANAPATQVSWSGASAGSGWKLADDYILIDATLTVAGRGIQTYTDNTAADANPKFTGIIDSVHPTPAGLIDTSTTTAKVPTAWSIRHATGTVIAADPNVTATGEGSLWFFHEDRAQVAVPTSNAVAFADGDPFLTAEQSGVPGPQIHFAQGPTQFGEPAASTVLTATQNAMYLSADFTTALSGRTYTTSTLRVELFVQ